METFHEVDLAVLCSHQALVGIDFVLNWSSISGERALRTLTMMTAFRDRNFIA